MHHQKEPLVAPGVTCSSSKNLTRHAFLGVHHALQVQTPDAQQLERRSRIFVQSRHLEHTNH